MALLATPAFAQDAAGASKAYASGDYETALRVWRPLAERGDGDAQASLGLLYARGQGVPQDHSEAIKWFRLSANQGYAIGQNNLGVMFRNGYGVRQDYAMALMFYRLSAAQGYAFAQSSLASMYENGDGTRRDYKEAYMWYTLAAAQGHGGAKQALRSLTELMSVEQRQRAAIRVQERQTRTELAARPLVSNPADTPPPQDVAARAPAPLAPQLTPSRAEAAPAIAGKATAWRVQLAALRRQIDTEAAWTNMRQANQDLLDGLELHVQLAELPDGTFYRVQAGPLADREAAASLCDTLKTRLQDCLIVAP